MIVVDEVRVTVTSVSPLWPQYGVLLAYCMG